jgi:uncharacterized protein (TIGR01777 family)
MKFLITGATGLVGNALVDFFLEKKHQINYLTTSKQKLNSIKGCQGFYWNPKKGFIDNKALLEVDIIINLAGASISNRWTKNYKNVILESRIDSLNTLSNAIQPSIHQVKQIVSASAIGIYPNSVNKKYSEDNIEIGNDFLAKVVTEWENSANKFKRLGVKVSLIRIGLVLSANGGVLTKLITPVKYNLGNELGSGNQIQSWIHINDLIKVFDFVINKEIIGVINGVAPNPVKQKVFVKTLSEVLGSKIILPATPKWLLRLILGEMHELLFNSQDVIPKRLIDNKFQFNYDLLKPALTHLIKNKA